MMDDFIRALRGITIGDLIGAASLFAMLGVGLFLAGVM